MTNQVRAMLDSMYFAFCEQPVDRVVAWDRFIDFLAADNCALLLKTLDHKFEWLFEDSGLEARLEAYYQPDILKREYYDHLGDMYRSYVLDRDEVSRKRVYLPPRELARSIARTAVGDGNTPLYVLDPAVGTGRVLMAVHEVSRNSTLYGVGQDIRAIRIAFTNFAIHGIRAQLLHANPIVHEVDPATPEGQFNWQFANQWYSDTGKLKPRSANSTLKPKPNGSK